MLSACSSNNLLTIPDTNTFAVSNLSSINVSNQKGASISLDLSSLEKSFKTKATVNGSGAKTAADIKSYQVYLLSTNTSTFPSNVNPLAYVVGSAYTINKGSTNIITFNNVQGSTNSFGTGNYYYIAIRAYSELNAGGIELIKSNNNWTTNKQTAVSSGNGVQVRNSDLALSFTTPLTLSTNLLDIVPASLDVNITLTGSTSKVSSYKIGLCTNPAQPITTRIASTPLVIDRSTAQLSGNTHTVTFNNIPAGTYYATAEAYSYAGAGGTSVVAVDNRGSSYAAPDNKSRVAVSSAAVTVSSSQTLSPLNNLQIPLTLEDTTHNYSFSGNVNDGSGDNYNASISGASLIAGSDGVPNSAYYFDGIDDLMSVPNNNATTPFQNNFAVSLWIKPVTTHEIDSEGLTFGTVGTSGQKYVMYANHGGDFDNAGVGISAGTNGISIYEHASNYMPALLVWNSPVSSTVWTHVVLVYTNRVPSLYVNGNLVKTGVAGSKINISPFILGYGLSFGGPGYGYFNGSIDDIKMT
ncbi:LamG domain-containing protein, partial [bacterium]